MLRKCHAFILCFVVLIGLISVFMLLPIEQAYAGSLSSWVSVTRTGGNQTSWRNFVNAHHFSLISKGGNIIHNSGTQINYYLDGSGIILVFMNYPNVEANAETNWLNQFNFTKVTSKSSSHVSVRLSTTKNPNHEDWMASVEWGSASLNSDGTLKLGGTESMVFYNPNLNNTSALTMGRLFAHELGHVIGFDDVYNVDNNNNQHIVTTDSIMGDNNLNRGAIGRPDTNGLRVLSHNYWYQTSSTWRYWTNPTQGFYQGWHNLYEANGQTHWFFFDASSRDMLVNQWVDPARAGNTSIYWGYVNGNGYALTGWQRLPDSQGTWWFCFNSDGSMYANAVVADSGGNCFLKPVTGHAAYNEVCYNIPGYGQRYIDTAYHITSRTTRP